jgi:hypothetical protein
LLFSIFFSAQIGPGTEVNPLFFDVPRFRPVKIIRLIAKHTIEEIIKYRASTKLMVLFEVLYGLYGWICTIKNFLQLSELVLDEEDSGIMLDIRYVRF